VSLPNAPARPSARFAWRAPRREAKKRPPIRVRTSVQPTFVRFVFEMPDGVGVSSVLNDQKLTLQFNANLTFDLADCQGGGAAKHRLDSTRRSRVRRPRWR